MHLLHAMGAAVYMEIRSDFFSVRFHADNKQMCIHITHTYVLLYITIRGMPYIPIYYIHMYVI